MNKTISACYKELKETLSKCSDSSELEARRILEKRAGIDWAKIITDPEKLLTPEQQNEIESDLKRRKEGEPLSRIYHSREFWGLEFELSPDTLDPRPETELVVELSLKRFENKYPESILDLGTGTGCLLIALLSEFKTAKGTGIDKSSGAVIQAEKNAKQHGVDNRSSFICSSWFEALEPAYDLIVSNPPYIEHKEIANLTKEVKNHDPILALDGGHDGLQAYKEIFSDLKIFLKPGGTALFEIGFDQAQSVSRLAEDSGLHVKNVHHDLAGLPRVVEISCGDK